MKTIQLLLILGTFISCNQATDKEAYFHQFTDGYYNHGFESIRDMLADTIIIKDGEYKAEYSKQEFKIYYQWDSVFHPVQEVKEIKILGDSIEYTDAISSKRFEFLDNNPMLMKKQIILKDNKIAVFENLKYLNADFEIWTEKRDSLVNWISQNHKELNGFIYDMTKEGAEKYLKAIDFYKNRL